MKEQILTSALSALLFISTLSAQKVCPLIPQIDGRWWQIAGNPDLGEYTGEKQQPVDFGIWQAADGTWQLWSCIRGTKFPGKKRLLYGWEAKDLADQSWKPQGIKWMSDTSLGEASGGMQAPFVLKERDGYYLFYGDWRRICLAKSSDGKTFIRWQGRNGEPGLFTEHEFEDPQYNTARDPMVTKNGNTYYCYYSSHATTGKPSGAAYARKSLDLLNWSESVMVSRTPPYPGNSPRYSDECPYVVYLKDQGLWYLFVTQVYGPRSQTTVYASANPMNFGVDHNRYKVCILPVAAPEILCVDGQWYIASTMPDYSGIRLAKLKWSKN